MEINKLTNCNVYLNGQTLVGKIEEMDLPEVKPLFAEYKPLGMQSAIELPSGFDKMETKIKWNSFYLKEFLQISNFTNISNLVIKGSMDTFSSVGKSGTESYTAILNVIFKNFPLGKFKQNEMIEGLETMAAVYSLAVEVGGAPLIAIDTFTNTYKVGATDLLKEFKLNS